MKLTGYFVSCAVPVAALLGLGAGYYFFHPTPITKAEPAAVAIKLTGGDITLARDPLKIVPPVIQLDTKQLGEGAKIERAITVKISPAQKGCDPVTLDLGVVKLKDDSHRVVAHAEDGTILGGVDIPVGNTANVYATPWAAGISYDPLEKRYGAFIERDIWRVRVGADVMSSDHGLTAFARLGWRF